MKNENEVLTVGAFKELVREIFIPEFSKIHARLDRHDAEFVKVRSEMTQEFTKVRNEMTEGFKNARNEMAEGFRKVRIEIRDDIIDVIDQNIQPQLTSAVSRVTRLERKAA